MNNIRKLSLIDRMLVCFDNGLQTVLGKPVPTGRPDPAVHQPEFELSANDRRKSMGLMRVNHSGEVSAQALYQGQALFARDEEVRSRLTQSAMEENDHLIWCETRLAELAGHKSYLNAFWYLGSFATGAIAGLAGDKWSLGFVMETEHQVVRHLELHLRQLPADDVRSRMILEQMKEDERHHATVALESGAAELPAAVKKLMSLQSKVMTTLAYWI